MSTQNPFEGNFRGFLLFGLAFGKQTLEFRSSELEKGIPKITPRKLSKELKDIEINGLILRTVYDSLPLKGGLLRSFLAGVFRS